MKRIINTRAFAVMLGVLVGCTSPASFAQTQAVDATPVAELMRGILVPHQDISISSPLEARVQDVLVEPGDRVQKGQPLVAFECDVFEAERQSASARLNQRELTHATNIKLFQRTAITKNDFDLSESRVAEARADLQGINLRARHCTITAPFAGIISEVAVRKYAHTMVGEPLLVLLDDTALDLVVHVPSQWIRDKLVGKTLKLTVQETGDVHHAKITRIWPSVDANSRTLKISARLEGRHPDLLSGMTADAELVGR